MMPTLLRPTLPAQLASSIFIVVSLGQLLRGVCGVARPLGSRRPTLPAQLASSIFIVVSLGVAGLAPLAAPGPQRTLGQEAPARSAAWRDCRPRRGPGSAAADILTRGSSWSRGPAANLTSVGMRATGGANVKPKLALLMIVRNRVFNEQLWLAWIDAAHRDGQEFRLLIHSGIEKPMRWAFNPDLAEYLVEEQVSTANCDLVDAVFLLMDAALKDEAVTHLAMVSDASVPLKPLQHMYAQLDEEPSSRFCVDLSRKPADAEKWWLMRREDAILARALADTEMFQSYLGTLRKYGTCVDELLWYTGLKAYGANLLNDCVTFSEWPGCSRMNFPQYEEAWKEDPFPLLRAGDKTAASATSGPSTFHNVSAGGFRELLNSRYWFARKFSDGALRPEAVAAAISAWAPEWR